MKKKSPIVILTSLKSTRLQYVCEWIFNERLGVDFTLVTTQKGKSFQDPFISYGVADDNARMKITPGGWLKEGYLSDEKPGIQYFDGIPVPSWNLAEAGEIPDILGAVFWSLTRAEEYGEKADEHGRFPVNESWGYRNKILSQPWIDQLILLLAKELEIDLKEPAEGVRPSIDIDDAYAFKGRGAGNLTGFFGDLAGRRFTFLKARINWLLGQDPDPFDSYDKLENDLIDHPSAPFFFLVSDGRHSIDHNISPDRTELSSLIQRIEEKFDIGVHPSYRSLTETGLIDKEKTTLENITNRPIHKARFHYLRFRIPGSYRALSDAGIREDHSMIYPGFTGFRAGTGASFLWYDLERDRKTDLRIFPYQLMDRTLRKYLRFGPEESVQEVMAIYQTCKQARVPFSWIWHNSTLGHIESWDEYDSVWNTLTGLK